LILITHIEKKLENKKGASAPFFVYIARKV